jgi:two-component system, chemotaxis family, chemotaxis protein CheY
MMKASSDFPSLNARTPDGLSPEGIPYNILIVDDSIFVKKQLSQILTSENFNVIDMAGDGEEAVEKYKEHHPKIDLVTMDITMPKMDGISALEKIIEFDKSAKIIMISALGKQELVKKSLLLGAKNYIIKPLDRKKVLERVSSVIKRFS